MRLAAPATARSATHGAQQPRNTGDMPMVLRPQALQQPQCCRQCRADPRARSEQLRARHAPNRRCTPPFSGAKGRTALAALARVANTSKLSTNDSGSSNIIPGWWCSSTHDVPAADPALCRLHTCMSPVQRRRVRLPLERATDPLLRCLFRNHHRWT